jgi:hypothetical protein
MPSRRPAVQDIRFRHRDERDLSARPLRERRRRLEEIVAGSTLIFPVRRLAGNSLDAWAQVLERGYEGLVAKDEASEDIGRRVRAWVKVKVPGWTDTDLDSSRSHSPTSPTRQLPAPASPSAGT